MSTPARVARSSAIARLRAGGVASPEHDAAALLAHLLGIEPARVALAGDLDDAQVVAYDDLVGRRASREPLQHLLGTAAFRHVEVAVGPGVFTPRPETEVLAGWAIERARESAVASGAEPVVVDLCTGSGAIALSVADEVPTARVHAVELDDRAAAWAERNLVDSGVDLRVGDMAAAFPELDGGVDVVVCNPPYIPLDAWESVAPEARDHDPALALWSGDDGLDAMRVLERVAARLLRPGGWVGAEHADVQGSAAPAVFTGSGRWREVADHRDLAGRDRFVVARLAP